ncbi:nuclear transport factor 2 family protein [Nonomuraea sp. FMUSA5-5]|uniref:Nuclear transport factor 2 family protein n=1 Tax=Nonomuraea composti TaxID=2720023 RepID=A0ABX1AVK9_9ACTN|nr:nuclear transport factor 2 family protein [Nonomuraea sp. FMUSA5-5]NJP88916.1 nuclear transport factor 2 family protein [Nonomuraea sp. FMUSA5-5]
MSTDPSLLLQHDQSFFDALTAADAGLLRSLLSDDFVLVSVENGAVADKELLLSSVASGSLSFPRIDAFPEESVVRFFGDVGIVVGRTGMNFTGPDGSAFHAASRYTHVYAATPSGTWHLVSAQGTAITT